jgi:predicted heme/steroid binding protein
MKRYLIVGLVLALLGMSACAAEPSTTDSVSTETTPQEQTFTKAQLAVYDGRNGQPAYVAVDGVVYDVTNSPMWPNGNHNGNQAGNDLTAAFASQHGDNRMSSFPVVGRYLG